MKKLPFRYRVFRSDVELTLGSERSVNKRRPLMRACSALARVADRTAFPTSARARNRSALLPLQEAASGRQERRPLGRANATSERDNEIPAFRRETQRPVFVVTSVVLCPTKKE
ncbi:hypothetical protein MRX96_058401 [Rhipicephalus microplus]